MWQAAELRELRLFLALAEELHFGRTAERLDVTPSRVSQSLRALEGKLGAHLVFRTSRRVRLTPLGERLARELTPLVARLDDLLERTHAGARRVEGTLHLGVLSGPAGGPRLVEIITAFEAAHPACQVAVVQISWRDPLAELRAGEVDLMASWVPLRQPDMVVGPTLSRQPRVLAVARGHPLAQRDAVDVEELADHRVVHVEGWPAELREAALPSQTPRGRRIHGTAVSVGDRALLGLPARVARGDVVLPTVAAAAAYMGEGDLAFVPISGLPPLRSALVWRRPGTDPRLRAFIRITRGALGT